MTYKVFYHSGEELGVKTRVEKGRAIIDDSALHLEGTGGFSVPLSDVTAVELFRLHGTMRVIKVDHSGGRLYLSVTRFMVGQFASVSFLKTGDLYDRLVAATQTH